MIELKRLRSKPRRNVRDADCRTERPDQPRAPSHRACAPRSAPCHKPPHRSGMAASSRKAAEFVCGHQHHGAVPIDAMPLKHALRQIQSNGRDRHRERSSSYCGRPTASMAKGHDDQRVPNSGGTVILKRGSSLPPLTRTRFPAPRSTRDVSSRASHAWAVLRQMPNKTDANDAAMVAELARSGFIARCT